MQKFFSLLTITTVLLLVSCNKKAQEQPATKPAQEVETPAPATETEKKVEVKPVENNGDKLSQKVNKFFSDKIELTAAQQASIDALAAQYGSQMSGLSGAELKELNKKFRREVVNTVLTDAQRIELKKRRRN